MTLLFDGKYAFFAERNGARVSSLRVKIPANSALFLDGMRLTETALGEVSLPKALLRAGENALSLLLDGRIYPVEGLRFDGETVTPVGLSTEALLIGQHAHISNLTKALADLSARVAALEEKSRAHTLFY